MMFCYFVLRARAVDTHAQHQHRPTPTPTQTQHCGQLFAFGESINRVYSHGRDFQHFGRPSILGWRGGEGSASVRRRRHMGRGKRHFTRDVHHHVVAIKKRCAPAIRCHRLGFGWVYERQPNDPIPNNGETLNASWREIFSVNGEAMEHLFCLRLSCRT